MVRHQDNYMDSSLDSSFIVSLSPGVLRVRFAAVDSVQLQVLR